MIKDILQLFNWEILRKIRQEKAQIDVRVKKLEATIDGESKWFLKKKSECEEK